MKRAAEIRAGRVRARAVLMGVKLSQIAEILDVSVQTIYNWLASEKLPDSTEQQLSQVLGVKREWLNCQSLSGVGEGLDEILA